MDINAIDSGSRVTRSLRKRLTSIDGDNSSRPGTPLSTKLTSITEISAASPSKSTRSTRRNSVSGVATPVKTPAKRGIFSSVIAENPELPVRNTRRRSILPNDSEEIRQISLQIPTSETTDPEIGQCDEKQTMITRSKSKSPQQDNLTSSPKKRNVTADKQNEIKNTRKRKPGPRSKTCEQEEFDGMSDVEISVIDDVISEVKNHSSNMTIVLTDDDSNPISNQTKISAESIDQSINENYLKPTPNTVNVSEINSNSIQDTEPNTDKCTDVNNLVVMPENSVPQTRNDCRPETVENVEQILHARIENKQQETDMSEMKNYFEENKNLSKLEFDDNANSINCKTIEGKENELLNVNGAEENGIKCDNILNDCLSSENKNLEKVNNLDVNPIASCDYNEVLKKVDFINSPSNDHSIKIVYPKTPASTKAVTFNKLRSSVENCMFQPKSCLQNQDIEVAGGNKNTTNDKDGFKCSNKSDIDQSTLITYEQNFKIVRDKMEVVAENTQKKEGSPHKEIDKSIVLTNNHNEEELLKWINPSVKRITGEGSKLDVVLTNSRDSSINKEYIISQRENNRNRFEFSFDDDEDQDEEEYEKKNEFIDDEAMEDENYKSGDSMDSKDRLEIELNEIPVDAESIGSQTTDDDEDEFAEEDDSVNSFIVSDSEYIENSKYDDNEYEEIGKYEIGTESQTTKKLYRRIQCPNESTSSSDELADQKSENYSIGVQNTNEQREISKSVLEKEKEFEKISIDCQTKTSDSFNAKYQSNKSCNIDLNSSKFSNSELRLHYSKSDEDEEANIFRKNIPSTLNHLQRLNKSVRDLNLEVDEQPNNEFMVAENNAKDEKNISSSSEDIHIDSHLGEISVTSGNDADKEYKDKSSNLSSDQKSPELRVSIENRRKPKEKITGDIFKDGEFVTDGNSEENELNDLSTTYNQEYEASENGIECVENMRQMHLQLGNPLIRTRRQSLALPTNPDMEICSSYVGINKKVHRKSFPVLSNIDIKPSQSFIENIEQMKNEKDNPSTKRKRLSKSFGGSTEAHGDSILDINTRPPQTRSKLIKETRMEEGDPESEGQIDSSKIFTKICSTPREKINTNNSYNQRILTRCDEILEAANRAKLEAKINNKKNKSKTSKRWKKKSDLFSSEETSPVEKFLRSVPMDLKDKEKPKIAISQAFMAADVILNKSKISNLNEIHSVKKNLRPDDIEMIPSKKNCGKGINQQNEKIENVKTSAGIFMGFPQTPAKKKKVKYIQLPTGKISVEPITPKKSLVQTFSGKPFRESPLTPCTAGFTVKKINLPENNMSASTISRTCKRKRCIDESFKNIARPDAQWTRSGPFTEEVISNIAPKKTKQRQDRKQYNVHQNFKENALSRPDINRSTKRELFLIKERKRACETKRNI